MWVTSTEGVPWMKLWGLSVSSCILRQVNRLPRNWSRREVYCYVLVSAALSLNSRQILHYKDFFLKKEDRNPELKDQEWSKHWTEAAADRWTATCLYFELFFLLKGGKQLSQTFRFFFLSLFVFLADSCLRQDAASTGDLILFAHTLSAS